MPEKVFLCKDRDDRMKIGYVLRRFPVLSETFVSYEIQDIINSYNEVFIFSLLKTNEVLIHDHAKDLLPRVIYSRKFTDLLLIKANIVIFWYYPFNYIVSIVRVVKELYSSPLEMIKVFYLFPNIIYFTWVCKNKNIGFLHTHFPGLSVHCEKIISQILNIGFSFQIHTPANIVKTTNLKIQLLNAKFIGVDSYLLKEKILEKYPYGLEGKIHTVRQTVNLKRAINKSPQTTIKLTMLTVGRLIPKKGID